MDTSHLAEHVGAAGSVIASVFVVATYTMRTMIPLRIFGMLTNVILIATAIPSHNYLQLVLHGFLLPMNGYRLHQMLQLVRDVKKSVNSDLSMEWLKPFMTERKCAAGEVLFYKDEKAESMFYIVSGRFALSSPASSCRSAPSLANSGCCRPRICGPRHWNASKTASCSA